MWAVLHWLCLSLRCMRIRVRDDALIFWGAAPPETAKPLYLQFCDVLQQQGVSSVARGVFGAHMDVRLLNDGPVTLIIDTP